MIGQDFDTHAGNEYIYVFLSCPIWTNLENASTYLNRSFSIDSIYRSSNPLDWLIVVVPVDLLHTLLPWVPTETSKIIDLIKKSRYPNKDICTEINSSLLKRHWPKRRWGIISWSRCCQCYHNVDPAREPSITPDPIGKQRSKQMEGQWSEKSGLVL